MEFGVVSVLAVQILAVVTIAAALLLYLLRFRRVRLDVANKAVLVTSCDSVLGFSCALRLDELGFRVFAGCASPEGQHASTLRAQGSDRLRIVQLDASNCEKLDDAVEHIQQHLPMDEKGLWALVNTTCRCVSGLLESMSWEQCERQVNDNLVAAIRLTKAFLPLVKRRKGRMVTVSSLGGQPCYPGFSVYASCKVGVEGFFEALRYEMQRYEVKFVTISPTIQYQFETRADQQQQPLDVDGASADSAADHSSSTLAATKFGDTPKLCVLDTLTTDAILAHLEDAVLSTRPLARYTSSPNRRNLKNVAHSLLPHGWRKRKLTHDFQSSFLRENV